MADKPKLPREEALAVAKEICTKLLPFVERVKIVGSIRRHKKFVGDIELLFVPKFSDCKDLFGAVETSMDLAHDAICKWEMEGYSKRRPNVNGGSCWGLQNKFSTHLASGMPVDLFATTAPKWFNSLVIRTGGKRTNLQLTMSANRRGLRLNAYGEGFTELNTGDKIPTHSEEDVFRLAGLTYVEPQYRV